VRQVGLVRRNVRLEVEDAHGVFAVVGAVGQGRSDVAHLHRVDGKEDGGVKLIEREARAPILAVGKQAPVGAAHLVVAVFLGCFGKRNAVAENLAANLSQLCSRGAHVGSAGCGLQQDMARRVRIALALDELN
nr:hypothetical protein [Tanacetum cinerariifolium]